MSTISHPHIQAQAGLLGVSSGQEAPVCWQRSGSVDSITPILGK
jgi:hypothetical protein